MNISMTCEYCDDNSHLTIECQGLRPDIAPVRAFKAAHPELFPPAPAPRVVVRRCGACGEREWGGRKMFAAGAVSLVCGDCKARGVPLVAPKVEPLTAADCCAWETPCDEGVG